jgi:hypothetical protein
MALPDLVQDIESHRQRVDKAGFVDVKTELRDNLYPLLRAILEEAAHDLTLLQEGIEDLHSPIDEELAAQVLGLTELCSKLVDVFPGELTDEQKSFIEAITIHSKKLSEEITDIFSEEEEETDE